MSYTMHSSIISRYLQTAKMIRRSFNELVLSGIVRSSFGLRRISSDLFDGDNPKVAKHTP